MKRFILSLLFTLFLFGQTCADGFFCARLSDVLLPREKVAFRNLFPDIDPDSIQLVKIPEDGIGGTVAYVNLKLEAPSYIIWLDEDDWEGIPLVPGIMQVKGICITILHETVHVQQTRRGAAYRAQVNLWMDTMEYGDHPHEREAYAVSELMFSKWPVLR